MLNPSLRWRFETSDRAIACHSNRISSNRLSVSFVMDFTVFLVLSVGRLSLQVVTRNWSANRIPNPSKLNLPELSDEVMMLTLGAFSQLWERSPIVVMAGNRRVLAQIRALGTNKGVSDAVSVHHGRWPSALPVQACRLLLVVLSRRGLSDLETTYEKRRTRQ